MSLQANYQRVLERVRTAASRANRDPNSICIVGVSKTKPLPLLQQAQEDSELNMEKDAKELAQYLTNSMFGIRVMAKMNPDREVLRNVIKVTLSALA